MARPQIRTLLPPTERARLAGTDVLTHPVDIPSSSFGTPGPEPGRLESPRIRTLSETTAQRPQPYSRAIPHATPGKQQHTPTGEQPLLQHRPNA